MNLTGLLPLLQETPAYRTLIDRLAQQEAGTSPGANSEDVLGIIRPARPFLVSALYRQLGRPIVLLTARAERVGYWTDQLDIWTGAGGILPFPEPDPLPYERVPWTRETVTDRLTALAALLRWEKITGPTGPATPQPPFIVASARALMHKTLPV
ncbi:MAG: hypothetical protein PVI67_11590, partial [Anaerolineae bacterium]